MVVTSDVIEEKPYEELISPTCPNCRLEIPWDADVCPHCGWQIREGAAAAAAPKPAAVRAKKGKKGTAVAAGSVIALALLTLGSAYYWPPAAILTILAIVGVIAIAAAPSD